MKTRTYHKVLFIVLCCILMVLTVGTVSAKYYKQIIVDEISLNIIADSTPPIITLSVPDCTPSIAFTVTGTVFDAASGVKSVTVNGTPATVNADGIWNAEISLTGTTVTAVATDASGNEATETITYQEFTVDDSNLADIGYEAKTDLVIPATFYSGNKSVYYKVVSIADEAFWNRSINSVKLPDSLISIGSYAFNDIHSLTGELIIPSSVTSIGEGAFAGTRYSSIIIPSSLERIERSVFDSTYLTKLTIPSSVTYIAPEAFGNCHLLTEITFTHAKNDPIVITKGAFTVSDYVETAINATNDYILNTYDWVADNRATCKHKEVDENNICESCCLFIVPEGGTYIRGGTLEENEGGEMVLTYGSTVYSAGQAVPTAPQSGDIYRDSDYEYCYGYTRYYETVIWGIGTSSTWAAACYSNVTAPGTIMSNINGEDVTIGDYLFMGKNLVTAPYIPNTFTSLGEAFGMCDMLKGTIVIDAEPNKYGAIFAANPSEIIWVRNSAGTHTDILDAMAAEEHMWNDLFQVYSQIS